MGSQISFGQRLARAGLVHVQNRFVAIIMVIHDGGSDDSIVPYTAALAQNLLLVLESGV